MIWAKILHLLLGLASEVASYMGDKQLLEAGEAKALARQLRNDNERIKKVMEARRNTVYDIDGDGVPEDDGYRRG